MWNMKKVLHGFIALGVCSALATSCATKPEQINSTQPPTKPKQVNPTQLPTRPVKILPSGIRGVIVASDTAPVEYALPPGAPMSHVIVIVYRLSGGVKKQVARIKTNSQGRFGLRVPPGQYSVKAEPRDPVNPYHNEEKTVQVRSGEFAYVKTNFDCGF
jgi:hypothetical protein